MGWLKDMFGEQAEQLVEKIQNKVVVSDEVHKERLDICTKCEHYSKNHFCGQCHCYMPLKTKFAIFHCPIHKWD